MVPALDLEGLLSRYFRSLQGNIDPKDLNRDTSTIVDLAFHDQRE